MPQIGPVVKGDARPFACQIIRPACIYPDGCFLPAPSSGGVDRRDDRRGCSLRACRIVPGEGRVCAGPSGVPVLLLRRPLHGLLASPFAFLSGKGHALGLESCAFCATLPSHARRGPLRFLKERLGTGAVLPTPGFWRVPGCGPEDVRGGGSGVFILLRPMFPTLFRSSLCCRCGGDGNGTRMDGDESGFFLYRLLLFRTSRLIV